MAHKNKHKEKAPVKEEKFLEDFYAPPMEEQAEETVEEKEDRSAYNCGQCKGEGLSGKDRLGNDTVCTVCSGTGKA